MALVCKNSPKVLEGLKKAVKTAANVKRGKTYTELYGEEKANELKENLHKVLRGSTNPNWKNGEKIMGIKNPNWRGGLSFQPYTTDWTVTLKRSIRERDKYTCSVCGYEPAVHVHHIDYNKKNCFPQNLITVCKSCHTKTNYNRKEWTDYFIRKMLCL
jgi:hypothetical protein